MSIARKILIALLVLLVVGGILLFFLSRGDTAEMSVNDVSGTGPTLEDPNAESVPTIQIAEPVGWEEGDKPVAAEGLEVVRFAEGLDHPRVIHTLPNGDVLVTLTRSPKSEGGGGITAWIAEKLMTTAGAVGDSANELILLRDGDGDGVAETQNVIMDELDSPSGIAWRDGKLYVANHDSVIAVDYALGDEKVTAEPKKLMDLPPGGGHWMRNMELHPTRPELYIAVGSVSNIGEHGMEIEKDRAMIHQLNLETGRSRPFGLGLRNPNGLDFSPWTGTLWTTVNERDMLGSDLVPDYLTDVPIGAQYGWPWVYWAMRFDERVEHPRPQFLTEYTRKPAFALGPHVAALGLVFTKEGHLMGDKFGSGAFIARHGSWNRKPPSGYDVIYVAYDENGNPVGKPVDVLTGFLNDDGTTKGRPTWVEWAGDGALLMSDDTAGIIWRVVATGAAPGAGITPLETGSLPPTRELKGDPRDAFEEPPE
ncbi:MAG: PQQ-dependent sugar dehydrogenase [Marinomonas sp.]